MQPYTVTRLFEIHPMHHDTYLLLCDAGPAGLTLAEARVAAMTGLVKWEPSTVTSSLYYLARASLARHDRLRRPVRFYAITSIPVPQAWIDAAMANP